MQEVERAEIINCWTNPVRNDSKKYRKAFSINISSENEKSLKQRRQQLRHFQGGPHDEA